LNHYCANVQSLEDYGFLLCVYIYKGPSLAFATYSSTVSNTRVVVVYNLLKGVSTIKSLSHLIVFYT
jgi:hypothetical protein